MSLTASQRRYLRQLAHSLKPVVAVGNKGVTPALLGELDQALDHHELLKVRLGGGDREARHAAIEALLASSQAQLVQEIGHVATLYRPHPEQPQLALPR